MPGTAPVRGGSHELAQLVEIADITALDRRRFDRDERQCPGRAAPEQPNDHELATLWQDIEAQRSALLSYRRGRSRRAPALAWCV